MSDQKYNGWTNRATWQITLEILGGEAEYHAEQVRDGDQEPFDGLSALADYIEDWVEEIVVPYHPDNEPNELSFAISYARIFLDQANYYEIAQSWVSEHPYLLAENYPEGEGEWVEKDYEWVWQPEEDEEDPE